VVTAEIHSTQRLLRERLGIPKGKTDSYNFMVQLWSISCFWTAPEPLRGANRVAYFQLITANFLAVTTTFVRESVDGHSISHVQLSQIDHFMISACGSMRACAVLAGRRARLSITLDIGGIIGVQWLYPARQQWCSTLIALTRRQQSWYYIC
jgi:hypothetical protein